MLIGNYSTDSLDIYLELKKYVRQIRIMAILKQIEPEHEQLFIEALMTDALGKD